MTLSIAGAMHARRQCQAWGEVYLNLLLAGLQPASL